MTNKLKYKIGDWVITKKDPKLYNEYEERLVGKILKITHIDPEYSYPYETWDKEGGAWVLEDVIIESKLDSELMELLYG